MIRTIIHQLLPDYRYVTHYTRSNEDCCVRCVLSKVFLRILITFSDHWNWVSQIPTVLLNPDLIYLQNFWKPSMVAYHCLSLWRRQTSNCVCRCSTTHSILHRYPAHKTQTHFTQKHVKSLTPFMRFSWSPAGCPLTAFFCLKGRNTKVDDYRTQHAACTVCIIFMN